MKLLFFSITLYTLITAAAFNSSYAKTVNFNYNAKNISSYFSALISFDDHDYLKSQEFFKKIGDLKKDDSRHSSRHIYSLMSLEKYKEAERYSKNLENKNKSNFESNLILGLSQLKKGNFNKAKIYFDQMDQNFEHLMVSDILKITLKSWSEADEKGIASLENIPDTYNNFKKIQVTLAHCYFDTPEVNRFFNEILEDKNENYSRYYFFLANFLSNKNEKTKASKIINLASNKYPKNLLINQFKTTLNENEKNFNKFNCRDKNNIIAEIFYIIANALSVQGNYKLSNFYINLAKYLNPYFFSYNSLLAENFLILNQQNKKEEAISLITKSYRSFQPDVYQTLDFANFLKDRKQYDKSIELYSSILSKINKNHQLYPKVLDGRGTAYERINEFSLSEKDLLMSLEISPDQPYVMNYLAYSWLENGKNFNKALEMLRKANELKKRDGYITDSLGWALYKLNRFVEAKEYLKEAITLMPSDPIVNDHFADCLWKNNEKIQARYYWNYVLKLETTEEELKKSIENKLIFGLEKT